jgi:hypothetical protein
MLLLKGGCRDTASFFNLSTENTLKHRVYLTSTLNTLKQHAPGLTTRCMYITY